MTNAKEQPYQKLKKKWKRIAALSDAIAMLSWDRQAIMPSGAECARAEQIATLSVLKHEEVAAPIISDLLEEVDAQDLSSFQSANFSEMRRLHQHAAVLSAKTVDAHSRACTDCENSWRIARSDNDFKLVAKPLGLVVSITQEIAEIKGQALRTTPYDALLDEYEPGGSSKKIDAVFNSLELKLKKLLPEVMEYQNRITFPSYEELIPVQNQQKLGLQIMKSLGFDFSKGRLDTSVHPFSGGVPDDVRITTRYNEKNWAESLMGVIHETGHALYEQGLPLNWRGQPVGSARGMVLHESQSLLMEMQVCRSREFFTYLAPMISKTYGVKGNQWTAKSLSYNAIRVAPSFIRVDADELTYPLHVMLRYKLERALLDDDLRVSDLPTAWNEEFAASFGIRPSTDTEGCLQDIHWYDGAIGYFPTYTLGALAAAQLFAAALKDLPNIPDNITKGDFSILLGWLRQNVHLLGSSCSTDKIIAKATGHSLSEDAFIAHLKRRYLSKA
jgi:carboxypeptidase Taq